MADEEHLPAQAGKNIPSDEADLEVEEFVFDDGGEADMKATVKKLRGELKEAKAKRDEYLAGLQRERADFINYKKNDTDRSKQAFSRAKESFAEELLPVLDAYDLAFSNKEAWEKVDKNWRMGVEYIHQQLLKILSENGIEEISTKPGDAFDATLHEPMENIPTDDASKDHTIAVIIQKGYRSNGAILRPARVKVWKINN